MSLRFPISHDEHVTIGALLHQAGDDMITIADVAGGAYGAKLMDAGLRTGEAVGSLRRALDTKFWKEHPQGDPSPYGARRINLLHGRPDRRAEIRQRAATIIEPAVAYEPPPDRGLRKRPSGVLLFREHVVIGHMLVQMRRDLTDLGINIIQYAYGKTDETTQRARRAENRIVHLRCKLEEKLFAGYPSEEIEGIWLTHVYYEHEDRKPPLAKRSFLQSRFQGDAAVAPAAS